GRRHEAGVPRAIRAGKRVLAGPFLGEVGFELLYWIPVLRRLLDRVDRERVTVLARGGAGAWDGDLAAAGVDVPAPVPPESYLDELVARRRREGDTKQYFPDRLDAR